MYLYTEEDIRNIFSDLFESTEVNKDRIIELFNIIKDRYL